MTQRIKDQDARRLDRQLERKRQMARAVMLAEQAVMPLVLALSILALFLSLGWFGLFRLMPDMLRWAVVFALTFGFIHALTPLFRLRPADRMEADRFLERRNGLVHQPVQVQDDQPANPSPFAEALWARHQAAMKARLSSLETGLPEPDIAARDRLGLRAVPALLVVIAFAFSYSGQSGRLIDAFVSHAAPEERPGLRIDAWITPPTYTGRAPVTLSQAGTGDDRPAVSVPQFSELTVRVSGSADLMKDAPAVSFAKTGEESSALVLPPRADEKEAAATAGARALVYQLKLTTGGTLETNGLRFPIDIVADRAPEIDFDGAPRRSVNGALEIRFKGSDDHGIASAVAEIRPIAPDPAARPLFPSPDIRLDVNQRNAKTVKGLTSRNLTEHPLANSRVVVTLVATDGAGQTGRSAPREMTLPGRNFNEPLAAAVAEERQVFALDIRRLGQAVALAEALLVRADETIPNLKHFLLIRSGLARMKLARTEADLKDTADHLWEIALGIEDGELSLAEKRLRDAQQALKEALENKASDAEIDKLMAELRKAMDEFLKTMAERAQKPKPGDERQAAQNVLRSEDFQRMLDQIENLARSGNREAAEKMLSDMQRMMNNLQTARRPEDQAPSPMREEMDKLGKLLSEQQKLLDETYKLDQALKDQMMQGEMPMDDESQNGEPEDQGQDQQQGQGEPQQGPTADELRQQLQALKERQEQLSKELGQMTGRMKELGAKPGPGFGDAEREMKGAGKALGDGESEQALGNQGRALEALRKGAREMMSQMQGQGGSSAPGGQQAGKEGRDPLGRKREPGGESNDNDVKVPDEIEVQRAREILDAIRKKLDRGVETPGAPREQERRYLERLLDAQ